MIPDELDNAWAPDREKILLAMKAELSEKASMSEAEVESCCAAQNRPLWVLQRLGAAIQAATEDEAATLSPFEQRDPLSPCPPLDPVIRRELDQHVQKLTTALGGCERILRTPLPTSYTRHTSRFLVIWLHMMPLVLYPSMGLATMPASLFVAWALLGIEDIGVRLEEPFDVLPLWQ